MDFTITRAQFEQDLSRVLKGVGNTKILPIVGYVKLHVVKQSLFLTTTDGSNFITVRAGVESGEDGTVLVLADKLHRLISRTTVERVKVKLNDTHLEVRGNGTYKLDIRDAADFPRYTASEDDSAEEFNVLELKRIFAIASSAVSKSSISGNLSGYRLNTSCVTTDGTRLCYQDKTPIKRNALFSQKMVDLIGSLSDPHVRITFNGDDILLRTYSAEIFGPQLDGLDEYPDVSELVSVSYDAYSTVSPILLREAINRIELFADQYDNHGVKLTFDANKLTMSDEGGKGEETILCQSQHQEAPFTAFVNVTYLKDLLLCLESTPELSITIRYEDGLPLQLEQNGINLYLSLLEVESNTVEES